jgi:hypothetical protein
MHQSICNAHFRQFFGVGPSRESTTLTYPKVKRARQVDSGPGLSGTHRDHVTFLFHGRKR